MKLHYYPETDSLYIELKAAPGAERRGVSVVAVPQLLARRDAEGDARDCEDCGEEGVDLTSL